MPRQAGSLVFPTYRHLLRALLNSATVLVERLGAEGEGTRHSHPAMPLAVIARHFAVLAAVMRRTIVVSRYLQTQPAPAEEQNNRVLPALDRVFTVFAAHRIDVDDYHAAIDAELEDAAAADDPECPMGLDVLDRENADVPGRPPAALVGELCRDFGMVTHALPTEWLAAVPSDLRLLCARAAASSIRPSSKPDRSLNGASAVTARNAGTRQ